jgi:hypothetical protein
MSWPPRVFDGVNAMLHPHDFMSQSRSNWASRRESRSRRGDTAHVVTSEGKGSPAFFPLSESMTSARVRIYTSRSHSRRPR